MPGELLRDDNGLKYLAQPSLPESAVQGRADGRTGSGETAVARATLKAPDDWAGMEDAVYLFHLTATSLADRNAIDQERATVLVKATKRSMAEYVRIEAACLRDEVAGLSAGSGMKADLLAQSDALTAQVQQSAGALAGRKTMMRP